MITVSRKSQILDAAETLFAASGFYGASMRMVADAAQVGLGLVTHHFPSKENLFEAVIARRAAVLNEERWNCLDELDDPSLEDLLHAFADPYGRLIREGGPGWRAYSRLIALTTQDARWTELVSHYFSDLGREMILRMRIAEPNLDQLAAVRGYVHLVGLVVGMFASTGLLDRFSDGELSSEDVSGNLDPAIRFAAGGIRALAAAEHRNVS